MWKLLGSSMLVVLASACTQSSDDGSVSSEDALGGSEPRPFAIVGQIPIATRVFTTATGLNEICIVPKHFDEADFSDKDKKKEKKLCDIDWNAAPGGDVTAAALLPKDNSTNPATDVYEVTAELSRGAIETQAQANAGDNRKGDKLGRFKSSLSEDIFGRTTSYAPSIIGYYETSRILGNIAEVTPAVWRSMAVARHIGVAKMGTGLTSSAARIVKPQWQSFLNLDGAPRGNLTYSDDHDQLYGALIPKVSGDAKDKQIDTASGLSGSDRFGRLVSIQPISAFAGDNVTSAVQTIVPMQGVTEMLVLDSLLLQGDRLSGDNVSYIPYVYVQKEDGSIVSMTKKDFDKAPVAGTAVEVKKLYLNDVDAGLVDHSSRTFLASTEYGLLKRVGHLSPDLYARVQKLARLTNDGAFESYVKTEWRFTDNDYAKYKIMAASVAGLFKDRCNSGKLLLDLDVEKHLAGTNFGIGEGCQ